MADFYNGGPLYDSNNSDHIMIRGREFFQSEMLGGAVEDGTVKHAVWTEMIKMGAPVLLINPSYDADGRIMENRTAVFIPVDLQREVEEEFEFVRDNNDWSHCKPESASHDPEREHPTQVG